jgi:xanthine/CO dehydrogenase XdhC/CoxF family maturation factor
VAGAGRRGWTRDLRRVLTDGGDEAERPDFEEDGGGRPWWLARSPCGGGIPVLLRPREDATKVRLDVLELTVAPASSGRLQAR